MAVLTKIRNRAGLAVGLIGFSLVAFLISDALNNNFNIFNNQTTDVGKINGTAFTFKEFEAKTVQYEEELKLTRDMSTIDPQTREMVRDQVWNDFVEEQTQQIEFTKMGIFDMSNDELYEAIKADQMIQQTFKGPDGKFDAGQLASYIKQIHSAQPKNAQEAEQIQKSKIQWKLFEDGKRKQRMSEKYFLYVKAGINVNSLEAKTQYLEGMRSRNFRFVALNYNSIPDSSIHPADEDYKKYMQQYGYKYKQEGSRDLKFVVFDILPSPADSQKVLGKIARVQEEFNMVTSDSELIMRLPGTFIDTTYYAYKKFVDGEIEDSFLYAPIGKVVGPYFAGGSYKLAKLLGVKYDTSYTMKASHILVKINGSTMADTLTAKAEADAILAQIQSGARTFEDMAREKGTDGTKDKGGDLGWFREGEGFVKEFTDGVRPHKKGDLFVLKTQFGFHVIKVTEEKSNRMIKVARIEEPLDPSNETVNLALNKVNSFRSKVNNIESFEKEAAAANIIIRTAVKIQPDGKFISGLNDQNPRELIRFIFDNKKGDISEVISLQDKYVVAVITAVREKGVPSWEDVKDEILPEVVKMKKAEILRKRFEEVKDKSKNIMELAVNLKTIVQEAPNHLFNNPNIPYAGNEPKLLGSVFGSKKDKMSGIIEGAQGVYICVVDAINEPANPMKDFTDYKKQLTSEQAGSGEYLTRNAIKQAADIEDFRYRWSN